MDTVTILRRLWRFRIAVAAIALLAITIGVFVSYDIPSMKSRKYTVGVGSARILVDTPASQVVDLSPEGSDSVSSRAALLSSLMIDGEIKDAIAKEAGLRPEQLVGIDQNASVPAEADAGPPARDRFVLSPEVTMISSSTWLPIIQVTTQAPTRAGADKLANAAMRGLTDYLDSKAASEAIPGAKRLRVSGLGAAEAHDETRGPSLVLSLVATLGLFVLGCTLLLGIAELVRQLRNEPALVVATKRQHPGVEMEIENVARPVAHEPSASPAAQLYELDKRRESLRAEEHAAAVNDKQAAAASGATAPPPSRDRAGWWGGGPS